MSVSSAPETTSWPTKTAWSWFRSPQPPPFLNARRLLETEHLLQEKLRGGATIGNWSRWIASSPEPSITRAARSESPD